MYSSIFVCKTEKKALCDKNGVNYVIRCVGCENLRKNTTNREHHGDTSKNAYTGGKQHQDVYKKQLPDS